MSSEIKLMLSTHTPFPKSSPSGRLSHHEHWHTTKNSLHHPVFRGNQTLPLVYAELYLGMQACFKTTMVGHNEDMNLSRREFLIQVQQGSGKRTSLRALAILERLSALDYPPQLSEQLVDALLPLLLNSADVR